MNPNLVNAVKGTLCALALASATVSGAHAAPTCTFGTQCDLSGAVGDTAADGTVVYQTVDEQSTGRGILDAFVEMSLNDTPVQAYNTTVNNVYNNGGSDQHNHEITVGEVGFVTADPDGDGTTGTYMVFVLDIDQQGSASLYTLDEVQIFLTSAPNQSVEPALSQGQLVSFTSSQLVYQLDSGGTNKTILLDYNLNSGSGSGDVYLYIPEALITSAYASLTVAGTKPSLADTSIFLYSRFGADSFGGTQYANNDGPEEWGYLQGSPPGEPPCVPGVDPGCGPNLVPEPTSLSLIGLSLLGMLGLSRRRRH